MSQNTSQRRFLLSLLSATALTVVAAPAYATPGCGTLVGSAITVTGAASDCYIDNGHSLLVTSTGEITSPNDPVKAVVVDVLQSAGSITNNGIIDGGVYNSAVNVQGGGVTGDITNNLTMIGDAGIIVERGDDEGDLVGGLVTGNIINSATGSINVDGPAVGVFNSEVTGNIENQGLMQSGWSGIRLETATIGGSIINGEDGNINDDNWNGGFGLFAGGSTIAGDIDNSGRIDGGEGGVSLDTTTVRGDLINRAGATISGGNGPGYSDGVTLYGSTIEGNFTNLGQISSTSDIGIQLINSSINGAFLNEEDATILGDESGIVMNNASIDGGFTNNGEIYGATDYGVDLDEDATITGNFENTGTIWGKYAGVRLDDDSVITGDFINSGTIHANSPYGDPEDNGEALTVEDDAIITGKIDNTGSILASASDAIGIYNGAQVQGGIVNGVEGIIRTTAIGSDYAGIYIDTAIVNNGIENSGLIQGSGGIYITGDDDSAVLSGGITNNEDATIRGNDYSGIYVSDADFSGGITNHGTIVGNDYGIYFNDVDFDGGSINNYGTIESQGGGDDIAIYTQDSSAVTVNNYGNVVGSISLAYGEVNLEGNTGRVQGHIYIDGDDGAINVNGQFAAEGEMYANYINIATTGQLTANRTHGANYLYTENLQNDGKLIIGASDDFAGIYGNYTQSADATLQINARSLDSYSRLGVLGTADFAAGSKIFVDVAEVNSMAIGLLDNVVQAGALNATTFNVTDNSALFNFNAIIDGDNLDLGVVKATTVSEITNGQGNNAGSGAAKAIDEIIDTNPNGNFTPLIDALGSLETDEEVSNAVTQTTPTTSGSSTQSVMTTTGTTSRIVQSRENGNQGMSSGDGFITNGNAWFKPYGSWAGNDTQSGVPGFDANSYGVVAGADKEVAENLRLGLALGYGNTFVRGRSAASGQSLEVNTYQAMFYGSHDFAEDTEINFQLGGGINTNDGKRIISFGGLNDTAYADYTSYSFDVGAGVGHTLHLSQDTTFTPSVRADYVIVKSNSYTEDGAGALNLDVDNNTADQLIPAIDGKLHHKLAKGVDVAVNAGVGYDVLAERGQVTSSYVGGGGTFVTEGAEPSNWIYRGGAGITLDQFEGIELTARYDIEQRGGEFDNQTVSLKVRAPF